MKKILFLLVSLSTINFAYSSSADDSIGLPRIGLFRRSSSSGKSKPMRPPATAADLIEYAKNVISTEVNARRGTDSDRTTFADNKKAFECLLRQIPRKQRHLVGDTDYFNIVGKREPVPVPGWHAMTQEERKFYVPFLNPDTGTLKKKPSKKNRSHSAPTLDSPSKAEKRRNTVSAPPSQAPKFA